MGLHGKEKIWFLVSTLEKERDITPKGKPVGLRLADDLNLHYNLQDLVELSEKLEKEENAIKLVSLPTDQTYNKVLFSILSGFDKYVTKLEDDPEYLEWSGKKPKPKGAFFGNQVDFNKSKEENKDKYISVGQIEEFQKMPKAEQDRLKKESLTEKHIKDINEWKGLSLKIVEDIKKNLKFDLPNFENPYSSGTRIVVPRDYQAESVGLLRQLVEERDNQEAKKDNRILTISYTKTRQVLLNDMLQLAQPIFNRENDQVFSFLMQNSNKSFSKKQLEDQLKIKISKPLHKIVENLGFKGDLAKAFFSVSKNDIRFKNPVTQAEIEEMGIGKIRLNKPSNS